MVGAVAERHQDEAGVGDVGLRRAGQHAHNEAAAPADAAEVAQARAQHQRHQQQARPEIAVEGEVGRRKADGDAVLGGDEAGRPAEGRAHAAQDADQDAGRCAAASRSRSTCNPCAGDLSPPDTLGSRRKSNREIRTLAFTGIETLMAKSRKVIITCAVTGSIHTPSMSPHLPVTAAADRRRRDRRGRGGRRDRPSACAQPAGRPARPDAGGLRAVPQGDQAALQRGGEHHHRRRADHDGGRARQAGRDLQAGSRLAQHGHDELRALPDDPALQGQVQTRLGGAVSRSARKAGMFKNTFADIEYILTTCAGEQHALRDRVLRHRPSLHAAAFPRPRRWSSRRCSCSRCSASSAASARTRKTSS